MGHGRGEGSYLLELGLSLRHGEGGCGVLRSLNCESELFGEAFDAKG